MSSSKGRRSSRTESRAVIVEQAPPTAGPRWPEVVLGILDGFDDEGHPLVDFSGSKAGAPITALSTAPNGIEGTSDDAR
jgi:hypothetical protein